MRTYLTLTLPYRLASETAIGWFVRTWIEEASDLVPTHASTTEPIRSEVEFAQVVGRRDLWDGVTWLASRRKPSVNVQFLDGIWWHSSVMCDFDASVPLARIRRLALALAEAMQPDFGLVHPLTYAELDEERGPARPDLITVNRRTGSGAMSAGAARQINSGIPTMYWLTMFGRPFDESFESAAVRQCGGSVDEQSWGRAVEIALVPEEETWHEFVRQRNRLKQCLNGRLFRPDGQSVPQVFRDRRQMPFPQIVDS